jgi:hypothetical protein
MVEQAKSLIYPVTKCTSHPFKHGECDFPTKADLIFSDSSDLVPEVHLVH